MVQSMAGNVNVSERLLMGPGPSPVPPAVRQAMALPVLGHLDPEFLAIMDRTSAGLRQVLGTGNRLTLPLSGTGSAGMEAALVNWVEPGQKVLVVRHGLFGDRIRDGAEKLGAEVSVLDAEWGQAVSRDQLTAALASAGPFAVVAVVMAETSTGVFMDLEGWADLVHAQNGLLIVDAVTAIGGMPVEADRKDFDVVFAGTQKCLSVPPGLAPLTASERAVARLQARKTPIPSWYLDLTMVMRYWGAERFYHHTAPVSMIYGLAEGLALVEQEGLSARFSRHRRASRALWAGLEAMGLNLLVDAPHRLPSLTTVKVPEAVDDGTVRRLLLERYGIEIGGGLGPLKGRVWRIGTMGYGAQLENVLRVVEALGAVLDRSGGTAAVLDAWETVD